MIVRELDPYIQVAKVDFQSSRTVQSLGVESDSLDIFLRGVPVLTKTILCAFLKASVRVFGEHHHMAGECFECIIA